VDQELFLKQNPLRRPWRVKYWRRRGAAGYEVYFNSRSFQHYADAVELLKHYDEVERPMREREGSTLMPPTLEKMTYEVIPQIVRAVKKPVPK
jgi:hypothetical protein